MYRLLKPIFFSFTPETAHGIIRKFLFILRHIPFSSFFIRLFYSYNNTKLEKEVFGLKFKNPVGLAAGFDKNGEMYNDLANFGFGFIEIGSITPREQLGNPRPRIFRLLKDNALINRMGLNNNGVKNVVESIKKCKPNIIIGGNISKNNTTLNSDAPLDYEKTFASLYEFVDYFVVNVSCPNVKGLSELQDITSLSEIVDRLTTLRKYLDEYRPILLKISPDLDREHLDEIIDLTLVSGLDGIVASNTSALRDNLKTDESLLNEIGNGGLSGEPIFKKSLETIKYISKKTDGQLPIIGVGGIMSASDANEMLQAGASLVQIYTGFIYKGPSLVKKILRKIVKSK